MGQFCQGIGLVHELGELGTAEEFTHRSHHRADVDQSAGSYLIQGDDAHALFGNPFQPE